MDFRFDDDQLALRDLAREILEKELTPERLRAAQASDEGIDRALWSTLAEASLVGVAVPEAQGGSGLGLMEVCLLLQEIGRAVAPVPALATLVQGALPIAAFGTDAQRERWLPGVASGEVFLSAALADAGSDDPAVPAATARREDDGFVLAGEKRLVASAHVADAILVPARTDDGVGLFLLEPAAAGVALEPARISTGERLTRLPLDGVRVPADALLSGAIQSDAPAWLRDASLVGACALQLGVCERALEITAGYVSEREQFGVPIGTFQAVQHRAADGYVDLECMRWTTWRAAWKLAQGQDAARDAMVAKFWAADAGARIAASAQHLHAGMGVDVDYPIHRYFLWSKSLELGQGGAQSQLVRLGRDMARTGPSESLSA